MGLLDDVRSAAVSASTLVARGAHAVSKAVDPTGTANREFDEWIEKSATGAAKAGNTGNHTPDPDADARKALHFDPFDLVAAMGYRERPSNLSYKAMERAARTVPVLADVINTRVNQVVMFCERQEQPGMPGLRVRPKDDDQKLTKKVQKRCYELEELLLHTGHYDQSKPHQTTGLGEFAKMFVFDSLAYDQAVMEIVPDGKGDPAYFAIVDASTIRLLDPAVRDKMDSFAVQVINGVIVQDFTRDELAFCVRNPRSGIKSFGYGLSEVETLVKQITHFLWAIDFNSNFFRHGAATRGVLNFKGTLPDKQLRAFRRQWYSMVAGINNAWRTPITNAEDLQWINMQMSNRDMEYSQFMDFLIKVVCSRYLIATEEVGFSYGNTGQTQSMGHAPIEEKLRASHDRGLRPLVRWFFEQLNKHFLAKIAPDYEVVPVGLDDTSQEDEAELLTKQVASFMTLDEAREVKGWELLGEEKGGHLILNPTYLQYIMSKEQQEQQAQAQAMGGGMPMPGGPGAGLPGAGMPPGQGGGEDDIHLGETEGPEDYDDNSFQLEDSQQPGGMGDGSGGVVKSHRGRSGPLGQRVRYTHEI